MSDSPAEPSRTSAAPGDAASRLRGGTRGSSSSRSGSSSGSGTRTTGVEPLRRVLIWTLVTLAVSAALQIAFYRHGGADALSDIPGRFRFWDLSTHHLPYVDAHIEYPVVIGYIAFTLSILTPTVGWAFILNCALNALLVLAMTMLLRVRGGRQIWRWVLGTPLMFFAFHNWDIWAMIPAVIGIYAYERHYDRLAGAALGVGASVKLFPGLFLLPLVIMRWVSGDHRGAVRLSAWGTITTIVLNGPIAVASPSGWLYPARFQGGRYPSWGTLWYWIESIPGARALTAAGPATIANKLSILVLGFGLVVITVLAVRRNLGAVAVCAAVTTAFLLSNKIYSPTYDLWLVPFFVLLPIPRRVWVAYVTADIGIFVMVFGRFHGLWDDQVVLDVLWIFVVLRAAALVAVAHKSLQPGQPMSVRRAPMAAGSTETQPVWDDVVTSTGGSRETGGTKWLT